MRFNCKTRSNQTKKSPIWHFLRIIQPYRGYFVYRMNMDGISIWVSSSQLVVRRIYICMSEVVYQIMDCTDWKYRLYAKSMQTGHRIPGSFTLICLILAYSLYFQPVQSMIWYTTSNTYTYSPLTGWHSEIQKDMINLGVIRCRIWWRFMLIFHYKVFISKFSCAHR